MCILYCKGSQRLVYISNVDAVTSQLTDSVCYHKIGQLSSTLTVPIKPDSSDTCRRNDSTAIRQFGMLSTSTN